MLDSGLIALLRRFFVRHGEGKPLDVVAREEWGAQPSPPLEDRVYLDTPVDYVMIVNTDTHRCNTQDKCSRIVQELQADHIEKGLGDILFNFLIGGDGQVYIGRGWHVAGSHFMKETKDLTKNKIEIAYIGTFVKYPRRSPPLYMTSAVERLIDLGVKWKHIRRKPKREYGTCNLKAALDYAFEDNMFQSSIYWR